MASSKSIVDYIVEQAGAAGDVRARAMFGEYGVYCGAKMVALICDDRLFLKPTAAGSALAGAVETAPPYPGAKPILVISEEQWDDAEHMAALIAATAAELPMPKAKRKKSDPKK